MTATEWAAVLTALGAGATGKELLMGLWKWLSGRQDAERLEMRRLRADLDRAEADRRRISEHASELRRILIEAGTPADRLPPWPIPRRHDDTPDHTN